MRLLVLHGSPRKTGWGTRFIEEAIAGFKEVHPEAEVVEVHLNDLLLRGCQHCMACKDAEHDVPCCVVEDDIQKVLHTMLESDAVLWGVPNYMGNYNGQVKMMLDRFYGFMAPEGRTRLPLTQKTGIILNQGNPDETMYASVETSMSGLLSARGQRPVVVTTIGGCRGEADLATDAMLQRARSIGAQIA